MSSTCVSWPMLRKPNHDWKTRRSSKMSGLTKFKSDHSSSSVFWIGVPDSRSRFSVRSFLSSRTRRQSRFLTRWPSSTTRYLKSNLDSGVRSMMHTSYDVTMTGKSSVFWRCRESSVRRSSARTFLPPWYWSTWIDGVHLRNSLTQFGNVASGAAMMIGPETFISRRCATSAMTWIVLPRPISSARMPESPFSYNVAIHRRPST
mmetsp:Transcript_5182/g.21338  ORF Transcript_5182/g.21338 Transcript_5182/m.21338 type:complete len:204 (+) Transcript_5182:1555-2166(+)